MENIKKPHTNYPTCPVFMALNNDQYPSKSDFYGTALTNLKWNKPDKDYVDKLILKMGNFAKQRHHRMMKLYTEISHLLYPYWAYNTKYKGMGLIIVCGQRMFNFWIIADSELIDIDIF